MWDLALIQVGKGPPRKQGKGIGIFTDIDHEKMKAAFWEAFE